MINYVTAPHYILMHDVLPMYEHVHLIPNFISFVLCVRTYIHMPGQRKDEIVRMFHIYMYMSNLATAL